MLGIRQIIVELFVAGPARDAARHFSAKTTTKKTTKQD